MGFGKEGERIFSQDWVVLMRLGEGVKVRVRKEGRARSMPLTPYLLCGQTAPDPGVPSKDTPGH